MLSSSSTSRRDLRNALSTFPFNGLSLKSNSSSYESEAGELRWPWQKHDEKEHVEIAERLDALEREAEELAQRMRRLEIDTEAFVQRAKAELIEAA